MDASTSRLLIHVGYPKTGSTWLQQKLFSSREAGFLTPWGVQSAEAIEQFAIMNSFRFSAKEAREVFEPGLNEALDRSLIPVLSHENLVGSQVRGLYWAKEVADRIYATFPGARLLVLIREQKSMILSSYRQYVIQGGTLELKQFIGATEGRTGFAPTCRLDYLEYDLLISYYQSLFGRENVLALPFELLKLDEVKLANRIIDFSQAKGAFSCSPGAVNIGMKGIQLALQRQLNFFFQPRKTNSLEQPFSWRLACKASQEIEKLFPKSLSRRLEDRWKAIAESFVSDYFVGSNRRTSSLVGIDLQSFGYSC